MSYDSTERRKDPGLRELVARASEGFVVVSPDRTVRILNEAAAGMLGVERAGIVGKPYPDPDVVARIERALEPGSPQTVDFETEVGDHILHGSVTRYGDEAEPER